MKLKGKNYTLVPLVHSEIVKGYRGSYYLIDLSSAEMKKTVYFSSGKYVIDNFYIYEKALEELGREILTPLATSKCSDKIQIFVKGSADYSGNDHFKTPFDEPFIYKRICYFPKYHNSVMLFEPKLECRDYNEPLTNADLPNLRASFLREKFDNFYSAAMKSPVILDGSVILYISEIERKGIYILFFPENNYLDKE